MVLYLEKLILIFFIYSFCGWFIETIGELIKTKKFINRGFFIGPYCPIYGTGALLITLLLSKYIADPIALFFLSGLLCGTLEYLTSYLMEKLFKLRWWDYSKMRFNINGRICLETLVLFAFAGPIILGITNPLLENLFYKIPEKAFHTIAFTLTSIFVIDCIFSFNIMNSIKKIKTSVSNQIKDNTIEISTRVKEIIMEKSIYYRRFIKAFPYAFADKLKERKEKLEKTAERVKEKALNNINEFKEKRTNSLNKEIFLKNYKSKIKLSLMKIYKNNKEK